MSEVDEELCLDGAIAVVRQKHRISRERELVLERHGTRDIVIAGSGRNRAFITTAHRGQNNPLDPQLTTPGVGRADVWVFDIATKQRVQKIELQNITTSIQISQDDKPLLYDVVREDEQNIVSVSLSVPAAG